MIRNLYILGIDHYFQDHQFSNHPDGSGHIEWNLKDHFWNIVDELLKTRAYDLVAEERSYHRASIAQELAGQNQIRHVDIDMTNEERSQNGIPRDYQIDHEQKLQGFALREQHMATVVNSQSDNSNSVLLLCGAIHIDGLRKLLEPAKWKVTVRNLLDEEWYRLGIAALHKHRTTSYSI